MGLFKLLFWSGCCIGIGVFLAKTNVGSAAPLEFVSHTWTRTISPAMDDAVDAVKGLWDDTSTDAPARPRKAKKPLHENLSAKDRSEINKLIAKGKEP